MSENNKEFPKPCYSHNSVDATTTAARNLIPILRPMSNQSDAQAYISLEPSTSSTNAILNEAPVQLPQEPSTNAIQNEAQVHEPQDPPINVNQNEIQVYLPQGPPINVNQNEDPVQLPQEPSLKPANVYIFNHVKFDDRKEEREGSDRDVEKLTITFEQFNCNVEEIRYSNWETVQKTASRLERENFEEHSALVIVVLSYGGQNETIMAKDGKYSLHIDILHPILKNQTLNDKPKIFFVQACKGQCTGYRMDSTLSLSDVYICYSTFEGYVSWINQNGSIFIQTLCEVLERDGETKDIAAIMREVMATVNNTRIIQDVQQIPSVTTTLTQKYCFGDYMHN
ncbi:uncharacterized protein Dwil_GK17916 [Drosophila willistoni]|uniref:Caspase family p20 domain-containing protein n=2 Tax=Drosophila willistoni TaxID=7260 RepID=B4N5P5_DROWI|nr:uncharacterized protein Dwil_GK17916 [Drosophila willistoni]